jgi:hypothetical protein
MNTGNPIVDVIGMLDCSGLVIPASWHFTITRDSGRPHYPAIALLAEIVSWYMPKPIYNDKGVVFNNSTTFRSADDIKTNPGAITRNFLRKNTHTFTSIILHSLSISIHQPH